MPRLLSILIIFFVTLTSAPSIAWNAVGHMVVAKIAYENLKPDARKRVDNLVQYFHHEYDNFHTFVQMAYWPDTLHRQKIEMFSRWHYINLPISGDGTKARNLSDADNAVWALNTNKHSLIYKHGNPYEQARALGFFIHIVGDLHQPLHTVSRFSASHPDGDKGGNLYYVRFENQTLKIHALWDRGLGRFDSEGKVDEIARQIMTLYPQNYFKNVNDLNPNDWATEGINIAKEYVYSTPESQLCTSSYVKAGTMIAEQQVAIAGYRLAALLNQIYG